MFASSETVGERKSRYAGGPHGLGKCIFRKCLLPTFYFINFSFLGDPDDFKLRKIENNVVIAKIVREKAKYEKCATENKGI